MVHSCRWPSCLTLLFTYPPWYRNVCGLALLHVHYSLNISTNKVIDIRRSHQQPLHLRMLIQSDWINCYKVELPTCQIIFNELPSLPFPTHFLSNSKVVLLKTSCNLQVMSGWSPSQSQLLCIMHHNDSSSGKRLWDLCHSCCVSLTRSLDPT